MPTTRWAGIYTRFWRRPRASRKPRKQHRGPWNSIRTVPKPTPRSAGLLRPTTGTGSLAETEFQRAIELKPQYGPVHIWYSHFLKAMGRTEESFEESKRALECDPIGLVLNMHMGWHYLYLREYQQAIEQLLKTLELDPGFIPARMFLGEAYEQTGDVCESDRRIRRSRGTSNRQPIYLAGLGHAYAVSGKRDEAFNTIQELNQLSTQEFVSARGVAEIYMGLGDKEQAFAWLDKAFEQRNGWLLHVKENPRYDSLRTDPRYTDLVRRMNLQ